MIEKCSFYDECSYNELVIEMEIKPTSTTTQILTTIINDKPTAFAYIMGDGISGSVCFYPYRNGTIMIYEMKGLPKDNSGFFGFHIHEGDSCLNNTNVPFEKTKGHYNPDDVNHPYHLGDLPPLFATKGKTWGIIYIDKFKPHQIVNRTIVIHDHPDDFHSQPAGNSGHKIACGEIKYF